MEQCECCQKEVRKIRIFQRIWGDESSETKLCPNCFTDALAVGSDIRDNSGSIAFEIAQGRKTSSFILSDGRRMIIEVIG